MSQRHSNQSEKPKIELQSEELEALGEDELLVTWQKFKEWWSKNGHWLLLGILLVVSIWTGKRFLDARAEQARESYYLALERETDPIALEQAAAASTNPMRRAQLFMRAAEYHGLQAGFSPVTEEEQQQFVSALERSRSAYQRALEASADKGSFPKVIRLRLAVTAERLGEWETARALYNEVRDQTRGVNPALYHLAGQRLVMLNRLAQPLPMASEHSLPNFWAEQAAIRDGYRIDADTGVMVWEDTPLPVPGVMEWNPPRLPTRAPTN